jgi:hypothetical protein
MIYFLHGTDKDKARKKAHELYESLLKKKPDASFFRIDSENWKTAGFDEKIEAQGLFENKFIVFLDQVFQDKEAKGEIVSKLKEISESENVFIFLEEKVDKATLTKIEKKAAKVQVFEQSEKVRKFGMGEEKPLLLKDFNIFAITNAFEKRDKKSMWVIFVKAKMFNVPAEEIHGVINWKLRMLLASPSSNRNYSHDELKSISQRMVDMYHQAHRGLFELDSALEQFILAL